MKTFMGKNFLLDNDVAKVLYHNYASKLPIIDYHCHVSPKDIAEDLRYSNITELWLSGDHYKWRAIRSNGVPEELITGDASDYDKFKAYAALMPKLIGNPLYHWSHLELRRYFGCDLIISDATCDEIWELTSKKLASPKMSVRNLIKKSNVEILCTTDDPADTLEYHKIIRDDPTFDVQILPAFRPDKGLNINKKGIKDYIAKLSAVSGIEIRDLKSLKQAYLTRIDFFDEMGCRTSDHGFDEYDAFLKPSEYKANLAFQNAVAMDGEEVGPEALAIFKTEMLTFLAGEYKKRKWVMQIHFGVYRNGNSRMFNRLGPDTGFDTMGGGTVKITDLIKLLNNFDYKDALPRTVLYSINPTDNEAVGAALGTFQTSGDGKPQVIQGSAWWFNDTISGMTAQMESFANLSVFGNFLGMLTDSRSFTSYPRHEYFRRIMCNIIGSWVEDGLYPPDMESLATMTCDIAYNNAKNYFRFKV